MKKVTKVNKAIRAEEDAIVDRQRKWVRVRIFVFVCRFIRLQPRDGGGPKWDPRAAELL